MVESISPNTTPAQLRQLLAEQGADISGYVDDQENRETPLFLIASEDSCNPRFELLLRCGANPNVPCVHDDMTLLHFVLDDDEYSGQLAAKYVELLLEYGANPNPPPFIGRSPLYYAVLKFSKQCIRLLLDAGAQIDDRLRAKFMSGKIDDDEWHYTAYAFAYAERLSRRVNKCKIVLAAFYAYAIRARTPKDLVREIVRIVWQNERRSKEWDPE